MACVATALVGLGGFLFGYDIGIISGVLVMPSFLTSFPGVASDAWTRGFVVTSFLIGGCLGAAFSGWLAGAHGRRATLRAGAALFIVGGLCQVGATTLPALFAARGVSGLAIGLTAAVVPVYVRDPARITVHLTLFCSSLAHTAALRCTGRGAGASVPAWHDDKFQPD